MGSARNNRRFLVPTGTTARTPVRARRTGTIRQPIPTATSVLAASVTTSKIPAGLAKAFRGDHESVVSRALPPSGNTQLGS